MNKKLLLILLGLIIILGGTLFDAVFIRAYTFFEYAVICTWEFIIFGMGMFAGYMFND